VISSMVIKKSLVILVFLLAIYMGFGAGTWAFFLDNEASSADQMASGTLDLKTDDADGVSQTLYNTAIAPGDSVGPDTIVLKNTGSVAGSSLDISLSYVESDGSPNFFNMSANQTAAIFEVITLSYDGTDLIASISDNNSNSYIDIQDVTIADLSGQSGLAAGAAKDFTIEITTDSGIWVGYADDGIVITMNFTLNQ
jgi:hypothetical protein